MTVNDSGQLRRRPPKQPSRTKQNGVGRQLSTGTRPDEVPTWVSATMLLAVIACSAGVAYVAPRVPGMTSESEHLGTVVNYLLSAVPFFFILIFVEFCLINAIKLTSTGAKYRFAESWSCLSAGIVQQLINRVRKPLGLEIIPMMYLHHNYAIYRFPLDSWLAWCLAIVGVDFAYYWLHRFGHTNAVLWAGHSVHHNSDSYNLSTALRQSWIQPAAGWIPYAFLALVLPPKFIAFHAQWNTWYQFYVHTCCIRRMGPLEWIFMTPSHHRVHHDRRVHKNYGGMFIVWDRAFGTFVDETWATADVNDAKATLDQFVAKSGPGVATSMEEMRKRVPLGAAADGDEICQFGVMDCPTTWTESVLQIHYFKIIAGRMKAALKQQGASLGFLRRAAALLWYGPGYYTTTQYRKLVAKKVNMTKMRMRSDVSYACGWYLTLHFMLVLALLVAVVPAKFSSHWTVMGVAAFMLFTLYAHGCMLDQWPHARALELGRCVATAMGCSTLLWLERQHPGLSPEIKRFDSLLCVLALVHAASAALVVSIPSIFHVKFSWRR